MMLVAFSDRARLLHAYRHAVRQEYRFRHGDATPIADQRMRG